MWKLVNMVIIDFFRNITGCVNFKATGGFGERFVNLCLKNNIPLWDISFSDNTVFATTTLQGYKSIRPSAKAGGMKTKIIKKSGIPFFIHRHKNRTGLVAGVLFFFAIMWIASTRIWVIDVKGNNKIPEDVITDAVEQAGLSPGCSRFSSDPVKLSLNTETMIDGVSEISINFHGSRATVIVKERDEAPSVQNNPGAYNIISTENAQLVILEDYSGTASAKLFNAVFKNQVLISGVVKNKDETVNYVHSSGYAVGRTEKTLKTTYNNSTKLYSIAKQRKKYCIDFFALKIPSDKKITKSDLCFTYKKNLYFSGKKMPLGITCYEYSTIIPVKINLSENQKELICTEEFMQTSKCYCMSRQVISSNIKKYFSEKNKQIKGVFTCYENIGKESELSVTESGSLS